MSATPESEPNFSPEMNWTNLFLTMALVVTIIALGWMSNDDLSPSLEALFGEQRTRH